MLNISSLIDLYLLLVPPPPPPPIGSGGRENAMIEMERIQNMNLGEGKEADGKVEDDRADGEREGGREGATRFHIEHQSKLRMGLARSPPRT